jgi:hypothetical protein
MIADVEQFTGQANMMNLLANTLAQVKALSSDTPRVEPPSTATTWMMVAVIVVAILLMAFKTARRNNQLLDD